MGLEISVSSARTKARAIAALTDDGYRAVSGSVRLAYPFSILVEGVGEAEADLVHALVRVVDPSAGRIVQRPRLSPA